MKIRNWITLRYVQRFVQWIWLVYSISKLTFRSLLYNEFADRYYVGDTLMEPMLWFVDHFTKILGPLLDIWIVAFEFIFWAINQEVLAIAQISTSASCFKVCVTGVILLSSSIITIAYAIGLPFYMKQNICVLVLALIIGHWLLINVVFYYYMAYTTEPGYPPQGAMITEAVSICKRCIAPKPPRTHHCIVCNRCILKMDHHCPWLNNCVGHFNHRYFFMFCIYSWVGIVFVIIFGIPIAYDHFFGSSENNSFSPILINLAKDIAKHVIFKTHLLQKDVVHYQNVPSNSTNLTNKWPDTLYHSCIVYAALICVAVFFILGGLLAWHSRLITNGETSIEGHINKKERERFLKEGQIYKNPYDFGPTKNWKIFLCIGYHRPWWYIFLPFVQEPYGDGIQWNMISNIQWNDISTKKDASKTCSIKMS